MNMRHLIRIVENSCFLTLKEGAHSDIYWFNPKTRDVRVCGDHGEEVQQHPDAFGISEATQEAMREDWEHSDPDDPHLSSEENEAWESLGVCAGWVRVGFRYEPRFDLECAYVSASKVANAWAALRHMEQNGTLTASVSVSIHNCDMGGSDYVVMSDRTLKQFLRGGPSNAHDFFDALPR